MHMLHISVLTFWLDCAVSLTPFSVIIMMVDVDGIEKNLF